MKKAPVEAASRRGLMAWLVSTCLPALGAPESMPRELRLMSVHKVPALGLSIWVEDQPAWSADLLEGQPPTYVVKSPAYYHPPAVMTYQSWRKERVAPDLLKITASTAIRHAAGNFGIALKEARGIAVMEQTFGELNGYGARFAGKMNSEMVDVQMFVGHAAGKFPVMLVVHTVPGKLDRLAEVIRRSWTKLSYL